MHVVPADEAVAGALGRIKAGQHVRIDGWLVRIDAADGRWHWRSSLSRKTAARAPANWSMPAR